LSSIESGDGTSTVEEGGEAVMDEKERELTPEEIEEQNGERLPDREAMSLITPPGGADGIATIAPDEPPAEV
jgi:hypothetical protein